MAIDTANKRRSAASKGGRRVAPIPDGSLASAADRVHVAGRYRGLTGAVVVIDAVGAELRLPNEKPHTRLLNEKPHTRLLEEQRL